MKDFCSCEDWQNLKNNNSNILKWDPTYGWVLNWIELTEDLGYTQVHRYGISISFCPMCGRKLNRGN
jgi:hypothetical protein